MSFSPGLSRYLFLPISLPIFFRCKALGFHFLDLSPELHSSDRSSTQDSSVNVKNRFAFSSLRVLSNLDTYFPTIFMLQVAELSHGEDQRIREEGVDIR
jgi:hypothetical protein